MLPEELTASPTGLWTDFGDGRKVATVQDLDWSLAQQVVLHPENVEPADDDARALVARARRDPETRRLSLQVRRRHTERSAPLRGS